MSAGQAAPTGWAVSKVIQSPTMIAYIYGRTEVYNDADQADAYAVTLGYNIAPLQSETSTTGKSLDCLLQCIVWSSHNHAGIAIED